MVPLRFLTFLFILSTASKLVTGTGAGNQDQVPCEDETKPVPTTTTESPTTTAYPCLKYPGTAAYKRQNGWWCSKIFLQDKDLSEPMSYAVGLRRCSRNNLYVSSLETEKEKKDYSWLGPMYDANAFWVNISLNAATGKYYWSDGYSVPTIDSQPKVTDPNGQGVWTVNKDPSVSGPGSLSIVSTNGVATPNVRGVVCGGPGDN